MNNRYYKYWSIKEPVFITNEKRFYKEGPFETILERLTTQLYIGMNFQIVRGPASCGKTTILREIARQLPVEEWDVLYLGLLSSDLTPNSLTWRLLGFLDTTIGHDEKKPLMKIISSLERLSKSKRKILVLLDIHPQCGQIDELEKELNQILEVVQYHHLPLYMIAASTQETFEKAFSKANWTGDLRKLTLEEASSYLKWCLSEARIDSHVFSSNMISQWFNEAQGSLQKLAQLAESQLIALSLEKPKITIGNDEPNYKPPPQLKNTMVDHPQENNLSNLNTDKMAPDSAKKNLDQKPDSWGKPLDENSIESVSSKDKSFELPSGTHKLLKQNRQENASQNAIEADNHLEGRILEPEKRPLEKKKSGEKASKKSSISLISLASLTKEV